MMDGVGGEKAAYIAEAEPAEALLDACLDGGTLWEEVGEDNRTVIIVVAARTWRVSLEFIFPAVTILKPADLSFRTGRLV